MSENDSNGKRREPSGTFWGGVILITLGVIVLLERYGDFSLKNWWALFIFLPALGILSGANLLIHRSGGFSLAARASLTAGVMVFLTALMFLLELSWSEFWPMFIIVPGLGFLSMGIPVKNQPDILQIPPRVYQPWLAWIGGSAALLGISFLLTNTGIFKPEKVLKTWWALFILLPAVGGLFHTSNLMTEAGRINQMVLGNLIIAFTLGGIGLVVLSGLDWNLVAPLVLIGAGILVLATMLVRSNKAG